MSIIKQWKGVCVNLAGGNNKWWRCELHDNGDVVTYWGKIVEGAEASGQSKTFSMAGENFYESKIREKQNKSNPDERYTEAKVLDGSLGNNVKTAQTHNNGNLLDIARKQIESNNPQTLQLIEALAAANIHNILTATGGQMTYNKISGLFETPLGIVNGDAILKARNLLNEIGLLVQSHKYDDKNFPNLCNNYLRLIPRNLGRITRQTPYDLFPTLTSVQDQNSVLDDLDASLQMVLSQSFNADEIKEAVPKVFDLSLADVTGKEADRITKKYYETLNHSHASSGLKPAQIWYVDIRNSTKAFELHGKKLQNQMELWHGSRQGNILSILKNGFVVPPSNAAHVTGRLYGSGVYMAVQSSKSLNYSYGYWDNKGYDKTCYMFLVNTGLGRYYVPRYSQQSVPEGYDSFWAKPGESGVQNDEIIVPKPSMCNPTYLIQFK